jgi:hypothetical protein
MRVAVQVAVLDVKRDPARGEVFLEARFDVGHAAKGNRQLWRNDSSGTFIISSDNLAQGVRNSTATRQVAHSEDGRYCVLIKWQVPETEKWCPYIVNAGSDYCAT